MLPQDVIVNATGFAFSMDVAGTYLLTLVVPSATGGNLQVSGNSTLVSDFRAAYGSSNFIASFVFTSTGVLSSSPSVLFNGSTGVTRAQFNLVRCKPSNALILG